VIAAASVPSTAFARYDLGPSPSQQAQLESHQRAIAKSLGATPGGLAGPVLQTKSASVPSVRATGTSSQDGFQWDDAGIGAAGMLVLVGVSAGPAGLIIRRRADQSRVR
jgi:hypothetical protein